MVNGLVGYRSYSWEEVNKKIVTPPSGMTKSGRWLREPDVTHYNTNYDIDNNMKRYMYGETQYEMLAREMEQNFYETMKSIEKYGGYYVGRYETGLEGRNKDNSKQVEGKTVIRKMQYDDYNINYQTWYQMYKKSRELAGSNENVKTSMIWGSLWDETLKWLVESGATTTGKEGVASQPITYSLLTNSIAWGNYNNATFKYIPAGAEEPEATSEKIYNSRIIIPTGSAEYTKANNIYDMAGNVYDWTLEAYFTFGRVIRGGSYGLNSDYSASFRNYGSPGQRRQ